MLPQDFFDWLEENKPKDKHCPTCEVSYCEDTNPAKENKCLFCGQTLEVKVDTRTRNPIIT
jgi:hypothetical protein